MKKQYGCIVPVSMLALFIFIFGLLIFPQLAEAQTSRNPCYTTGPQGNTGLPNCISVGTYTSTSGWGPLPVGGLATAAAPTFIEGRMGGLSFDLSGALRTSASGGGGGVVTQGTVPWVVSGQGTAGTAATGVVTVQGIASMTPFLTTTTLNAETTKVIGTVNQGTSPWVISGALTANQSVNVAQINGITPLMGNGATGTGSQRVTIASDNTAISVNAATQNAVNITPTDCSSTIATGGTAQNAFTANAARHGFVLANIDTTEVLWFSMTGTAAASGAGSFPLAPADATTFANLVTFTSPIGINTALSVIGATTAHKFTCTVY